MNSLYIIFLALSIYSSIRGDIPDLYKKEDLSSLGIGRIIEGDNSTISKITLSEVQEYWIIYLKDGSLHEMMMDEIKCIEFKESKWGPLKITFPKNKPLITRLNY